MNANKPTADDLNDARESMDPRSFEKMLNDLIDSEMGKDSPDGAFLEMLYSKRAAASLTLGLFRR